LGLVTFGKSQVHPPSSIMRSVVHQALTCVIFVLEVGKLEGGMWL
jgi:hypothetical protein